MGAGEGAYPAQAWRERLSGRGAFDEAAAERAISGAYRESGLDQPSQILWVNGPSEAVQALTFLKSPPRRWHRLAVFVAAMGAAAWVILTILVDGSGPVMPSPLEALTIGGLLAGLTFIVGATQRLPVFPGTQKGGQVLVLAALGLVIVAVLTGYAFVLFRVARIPADPVGRIAVLALAASVGALPGIFLRYRIQRTYAHLSSALRDLVPPIPVGSRLQHAREQAWGWLFRLGGRPNVLGPWPHETLLRAYRGVYRLAFAQPQTALQTPSRPGQARHAAVLGDSVWIPSGSTQMYYSDTFGQIPLYLDGIEDAARAARVGSNRARDAATVFVDLAFCVDRLYPFQGLALAVRPPIKISLNAEGRPHAEAGPAVTWADGTSIYAWQGHPVGPDVLDPTLPVTLSRIKREFDTARRWVLIERYGLGHYLLEAGASEIHRDDCGGLYHLGQPLGEPIRAVRVVNHTPEPDGSVREFWLRVPPAVTTARQGVAWTFGLSADEYEPLAQS